jgi:hypothetical protein
LETLELVVLTLGYPELILGKGQLDGIFWVFGGGEVEHY